jgi:hypothetical protein
VLVVWFILGIIVDYENILLKFSISKGKTYVCTQGLEVSLQLGWLYIKLNQMPIVDSNCVASGFGEVLIAKNTKGLNF